MFNRGYVKSAPEGQGNSSRGLVINSPPNGGGTEGVGGEGKSSGAGGGKNGSGGLPMTPGSAPVPVSLPNPWAGAESPGFGGGVGGAGVGGGGGGRGQSAHHSTTGKTNSIIRLIKTKNARWVSKSLSKSNEGAGSGCPITKYHRKLLSALWKGETNVTSIHVQLEKQNLDRSGNLAQCAKGLVLILRLMQFGPPGCNFGELLEYVDGLMAAWATMQAQAAWGEANDEGGDSKKSDKKRRQSGGGKKGKVTNSPQACMMVARLASLISLKIRFHSRHQDFGAHYTAPAMPRIFVVKAMTGLLDVGANADAVAEACFHVIEECKKVNDEARVGGVGGGVEEAEAMVNLAIEASFVLAPVLDESALIYNACEKLNKSLADGTGSPAFNSKDGEFGGGGGASTLGTLQQSASYVEAVERHEERKGKIETAKGRAGAPCRFVYGSESFVSNLYSEGDVHEMWFKTPMNSVEECCTAMFQLEHGELYAASKRGGKGKDNSNMDFFNDEEMRLNFSGKEVEGGRERPPSFSDLVESSTGKLEELLLTDNKNRRISSGPPPRRVSLHEKGETEGETEAETEVPPVPPPSASKAERETAGRENRVGSSALQARLARRLEKDAFNSKGGENNTDFDTLRAGTGRNSASGVPEDDDDSHHEEEEEEEEEVERGSGPAAGREAELTEEEKRRKEEEQQYHIRFQATNQPWRENMQDEVKALVDGTCSDFESSGIQVKDFDAISDFKEIGAGAFACVYRAKWSGRGTVAVKKLATQIGQPMTVKTIRDFRTEAQLQRTLHHPNIVALLGVCVKPLSLIMEFVPRGNLFALLGDSEVSLDWLQRLKIALGTVKGMAYLHAQTPIIIHRDLKSLNLLLTEDLDCKVTDFGLSRFKASNDDKMTGQCGTYHWMAPEVINSEAYTEKADVYSISIILWEIYTRAIPYDGMKPVQAAMHVIQGGRLMLPDGCPQWFVHLVHSAWDANPENRPGMEYIMLILEKAVKAVSGKAA
ncbi:hypothetical protein TrVE_jg1506 [Triparma verrucosa]|uniref:Protein kinase domain-containing protein n=1 Tax=Triparma verrucosa TaxID=1606542 RepID=A0A9W7EMQ4_9STRA|nr:hypothetical protein TrVE_jg1506 [Triparma verrucosa]